MHDRRTPKLAPVALVVALIAGASHGATPSGPRALERHLPAEPLAAFALSLDGVDPAADDPLAALGRLLDDGRRARLDRWLDEVASLVGVRLERELAPALGPRVALSVDFPPIDGMLALAQLPDGAGVEPMLARCGAVAEVRDVDALDAVLAAVDARLGPATPAGGGVLRVELPLGGDAGGGAVPIYRALGHGVLAVGFDADWVRRAIAPPAEDGSLGAGTDFARVFANLDHEPASWSYLNLPAIRRWVGASQLVSLLVAGDETLARAVEPLLDPTASAVGVGWTSVVREGGVRTSRFGPAWTTGLALSGGLLAALTMVGDDADAERAAIHETLESIREIGSACERFAADIDGYPGPTDGWVPVERIALFLEPIYVPSLPRSDAWGNPILYWSDGESYRLISVGIDGLMDRDWRGVDEAHPGESPGSDILFADGRFVVLPPQVVSE